MSQKHLIAAVQAQRISNLQISALLNPHREMVNRHVRLLKTENQPADSPGDFSGIPPVDPFQPRGVTGSGWSALGMWLDVHFQGRAHRR
ncbi:MAG: hypothetical protein ACK5V1_17430 [Planctomycetaceae bacterium]|jgi:hypothetical protein